MISSRNDDQIKFSPITVIVWAVFNSLALAFGVSNYPLWSHHPFPRESLCFQVVACSQILLSCMFFDAIAVNFLTFSVSLLLLLPLDELAGVFSNSPQERILQTYLCIYIWCAGITLAGRIVRKSRAKIAVGGLVWVFTLGGGMIDYLRWETQSALGTAANFPPMSLLPAVCHQVVSNNILCWMECSIPLIGVAFLQLAIMIQKIVSKHSTSLHAPLQS